MRTIENIIEDFRSEYPDIRAGEEDDWTWTEDAINLMSRGNLEESETLLKKLILSMPNHHDGYEYLAELYLRLGNSDALPLIRKAVQLAQGFYDEDTLDYEVLIEVRTKMCMIERVFLHAEMLETD